jgi:microcystin-dependent protein
MATPYVGEIRLVGFNFAPVGWAFCDGSLIAITENPTLFNLIGTTYGGNGTTNYALPNLKSRLPIHQGDGYVMGQTAGAETVTLTTSQIPAHSHPLEAAAAAGTETSPAGAVWAESALEQYSTATPTDSMGATLGQTGGGQPHNNMPTFLTLNYVIALFGIYPSPN